MLDGRKQRMDNAVWINAMQHVGEQISKKDMDALEKKTIAEIKATVKGKKAAIAWSGGKDSIVLADICRRAGIKDSMIALSGLEYPAFETWVTENAPEGCAIVRTKQDLQWLAKHPHMIFPQDATTAAHWFSIVQHAAQRAYFRENNLDILLLGRRKADGNYVGRGTNIYSDAKGITRYSPLSEWGHIHILAYIHYHALPLPPIYEWKNGYLCGTHPWPARQHTGSVENGWREVYEIDPSIVQQAAEIIPDAAKCLEVIGK